MLFCQNRSSSFFLFLEREWLGQKHPPGILRTSPFPPPPFEGESFFFSSPPRFCSQLLRCFFVRGYPFPFHVIFTILSVIFPHRSAVDPPFLFSPWFLQQSASPRPICLFLFSNVRGSPPPPSQRMEGSRKLSFFL